MANNEAFVCDAIRTPIGRYGGALASLNLKKQARIKHAASCYLQRTYGSAHWPSCRFDVILIQAGTLSWIPGAF